MFEIDPLANIITITKMLNDISKWMHVKVYLVGVLGSISQIYVIELNEWFFFDLHEYYNLHIDSWTTFI